MLHKGAIKDFFKVPAMMRGFYLSYGLSLLAATLPAVLVFFYIRDFLGAENETWYFLGFYFLSGIVTLPLWLRGAKMVGKSRAWFVAMVLSVIAFCGAVFLQPGDILGYGMVCIGAGLSFGAELVLPPMVLKDLIVAANDSAMATRRYGLLAFLGKAMLALVCLMVFPALNYFGYKPEQASTPHVLSALSFCYAVLPCIIKSFAIYTLWRWIKTYGGNLENRTTLSHRRSSHAA
ncbi:MAG: hypothetical protein EB059_10440 [Alphaproteobacteria bacterium]|nr:hypothetical protein [Alphaproteobacteria bacterium]